MTTERLMGMDRNGAAQVLDDAEVERLEAAADADEEELDAAAPTAKEIIPDPVAEDLTDEETDQ